MAGAEIGLEGRELAVERGEGGGDQRLAGGKAGIGQQIAGGEIIAAIGDEIVARDELGGVRRSELDLVRLDADLGVDRRDRLARALDLGHADAVAGMGDLALQVGQVDAVVIDDAERADPGRREVEEERRAEPAGADDEDPRRQ